jgi:hypothetical protein
MLTILTTLHRRLSTDGMKKIKPSASVATHKIPTSCGHCFTIFLPRSSKMRQNMKAKKRTKSGLALKTVQYVDQYFLRA